MRLVLWLSAFVLMIPGCSKNETEAPPVPVKTGIVMAETVQQTWLYSGEIQPTSQVKLSFKQPGYVSSLHHVAALRGVRDVQPGDRVQKGTVLASLRPAELQASLEQALGGSVTAKGELESSRADQEQADLAFDRAKALYGAKVITKPDYDAAVAKHEQAAAKITAQQGQIQTAQAQLRAAHLNLEDTKLYAPMPAVIVSKEVQPGYLVSAGTVGFTIADTRIVKVAFGVPDSLLPQFSMGMPVPVTVEGIGGDVLTGRVSGIGAAANSDSRVFNIEVSLPNHNGALKVGMIASVKVQQALGARTLPVVPVAALSTAQSGSSAYSVFMVSKDGDRQVAHLRSVRIGEITNRSVVIEQGLTPGDQIIVERTNQLADGNAVRIVN